ncbi:MAG: hypothetical protein AB7O68_08965 [Pirellulales bacterium]
MSRRIRNRTPRRPARRGIILLFVMALLALFALVTVTFVIVAHAHKQSARILSNVERNYDTPRAQLDQTLMQILVGSNNPHSSLVPHCLLEDMYGNDGLLGTIINNPNASLPSTPWAQYGQLLRFNVQFDSGQRVSPLIGALSGRVLTITTGPLENHSWRILSFDPTPNQLLMTVLVEDVDAAVVASQLAVGNRVLVNGAAFNGTGFGLDISQNMADVLARAANPLSGPPATDATFPFLGAIDPVSTGEYALLPNPKYFTPNTKVGPIGPEYLDAAGPGGADEDHDAADMQNMLLGYERVPVNVGDAPVAIPSLHRPELLHYWMQRIAALGGSVTYPPSSPGPTGPTFAQLWNSGPAAQRILRRAMMRPVGGFPGADHPNFTGSNPSPLGFDPVLGGRGVDTNSDGTPDIYFSWDVDNDGDGAADSVWVDVGLSPQMRSDGRMVKPLVAILCLDQDGKLNLNAHGTLVQSLELARDYTVLAPSASNPTQLAAALMNWPLPLPNASTSAQYGYPFPPAGTNGTQPVILPEGFGYGPAEINLRPLFVTNPAEYLRLLQGWPTNANDWASGGSQNLRVDGRYGEAQRWAASASLSPFPLPGSVLGPFDIRTAWQARWRQFDLPNSYWDVRPQKNPPIPLNPATEFSTPPDLNGDGSVAYDTHGQPIYRNAGEGDLSSAVFEKTASPYDINLSRRAQRGRAVGAAQTSEVDSPFTPAEWERLLRYNDIDSASMPRRLIELAASAFETGAAPGQTPNFTLAAINRKLVTTESWDVNVPSMLPTMELGGDVAAAGLTPFNMQLTDLVCSRLRANGFISSMSASEMVKANVALQKLLPWDLLAGVKLDINRPFGNGRDDTQPGQPGFGVVDEALSSNAGGQIFSEVVGPDRSNRPGEWLWDDPSAPLPIGGVRMDHNNDGLYQPSSISGAPAGMFNADGNDLLARQLYARHLYIMMCSLFDQKLIQLIVTIHNNSISDPADTWFAADIYRRFAQWAVNVVDSRDADSIMTPFEFDATPFLDDTGSGVTWNIDDNPGTIEGPASGAGAYRGLVWGCERPELLITESIAWHDRRTADTKADTKAMNSVHQPLMARPPDIDYDQVKRPQGTVFFELYVPWNPPAKMQSSPQATVWGTGGMPPAEFYHYDSATDRYSFQLDRTAPNGDPVWRMAVVNADRDVDEAPDNPRSPAPNPTKVDRTIYFSTNSSRVSAISPASEEPFYRDTAGQPSQILIPPGGYAVIGGATSTVMRGLNGAAGSTIDLNPMANMQTTSGVSIDGNGSNIHNTLGRPLGPVGIVIDQTPAGSRRLSLSEPYKGSAADNYLTEDDVTPINEGTPWDTTNPILQAQPSTMNGTALKKFTVYLQRLANPLLPWNPEQGSTGHQSSLPVNPYLSVDMMYVDLTVYNSEPPQTTGDEPGIPPTPTPAFKFETRERGFIEQQRPNIWSNNFSATSGQGPNNGDPTNLASGKNTLGYLNRVFGAPLANGNPYDAALGAGQTVYRGDPQLTTLQAPFPAFPWFNRPFINPYELMMIPVAHPFELLFGYVVRDPAVSAANLTDPLKNPYLIPVNANNIPNNDPFRVVPYGMLGPMYMSLAIPPGAIPGLPISPPAYSLPNFFRIMDFVQVPSRFTGTETILNPAPVNTAFGVAPPTMPETMRRGLYPPFNRVPRFREPGKVNINTIAHGNVWAGLVNGTTDTPAGATPPLQQTTIQWMKLMLSRRGSNPANLLNFIAAPDPVPNLLVDPPRDRNGGLLPTYFATPFRSYAGTYMVPTANMRLFNLGVPAAAPLPRNEIDATLLRVDPLTGMTPLLANAVQLNSSGTPTPVTGPAYADPVGNPATFYKPLHKIGGLVTNRSNVYAVWVTLGYFECDQVPIDEGHPDGYRLGREAGADTGEVRRHRSFFIVDRSIPVGFQRGESHNAENAILLRRFIE